MSRIHVSITQFEVASADGKVEGGGQSVVITGTATGAQFNALMAEALGAFARPATRMEPPPPRGAQWKRERSKRGRP